MMMKEKAVVVCVVLPFILETLIKGFPFSISISIFCFYHLLFRFVVVGSWFWLRTLLEVGDDAKSKSKS